MFFNINNVELEMGKSIVAAHDASSPRLTSQYDWPCVLLVILRAGRRPHLKFAL